MFLGNLNLLPLVVQVKLGINLLYLKDTSVQTH